MPENPDQSNKVANKAIGCLTYGLINATSIVIFSQIGVEFIRNFINPNISTETVYANVCAAHVTSIFFLSGLPYLIDKAYSRKKAN